VVKENTLKQSILAPLLSALILPGLGQVVNRQMIKGLILMGVTGLIFIATFIKIILDFNAVLNEIAGMNLAGRSVFSLVLSGMKDRNLTPLYIMLAIGVVIWLYAIVDAFIGGRRVDATRSGGVTVETDIN
jgi:TM2 domain-containing membrane protein YozV